MTGKLGAFFTSAKPSKCGSRLFVCTLVISISLLPLGKEHPHPKTKQNDAHLCGRTAGGSTRCGIAPHLQHSRRRKWSGQQAKSIFSDPENRRYSR